MQAKYPRQISGMGYGAKVAMLHAVGAVRKQVPCLYGGNRMALVCHESLTLITIVL